MAPFIRYSRSALLWIRDGTAPDCEFVPKLLLSHELAKPEPANWLILLSKPVSGCWLAARERQTGFLSTNYIDQRNTWVVILEIPGGENVTIELKEVDPEGNTLTVCRPGAPLSIAGDKLEDYAFSSRNEVRCHVKVEDWINRLEKSGVTRYRLQQYYRG
ncbi:uncharacterized protein F4822DRAFT_419275 [Hypoxylon trugodes]|uniref:uncharacterized protein n=1 Tax=Hypoxylon trugodes TaxID=326681 RepID=UPI0021A0F254|nr:uncharacterized protein F4822DRAFT_419275 [Hypoxylon trugodes]KAI1384303.1 hypothetical protein F4822DRAFT_419275 [Hypoxylon trugodes]